MTVRHILCLSRIFRTSYYQYSSKWKFSPVQETTEKYSDAEALFKQILEPSYQYDPSSVPGIEIQKVYSSGKSIWKTKLTVEWPLRFVVNGISQSREDSIQSAYHEACEMFKFLGLITRDCKITNCRAILHASEDIYFAKIGLRKFFHFHTVKITQKFGKSVWHSKLKFDLHTAEYRDIVSRGHKKDLTRKPIVIDGYGIEREHAEQDAASRALVKLKANGLHCKNGLIQMPDLKKLPSHDQNNLEVLKPEDMDFHLHTDASQLGYGAYCVCVNKDLIGSRQDSTHWIQNVWPDSVSGTLLIHFTDFLELYCIVSSIYTWKKKFRNNNVLVWSDNLSCVRMLNVGLKWMKEKHVSRIFEILCVTCETYKINLHAAHIPGRQNGAADFLCKGKIDKFRKIIHNASINSKKEKKLDFINPLVNGLLVYKANQSTLDMMSMFNEWEKSNSCS